MLEVQLEDLEDFFNAEEYQSFLSGIKKNTKRYISLFTEAADKINIVKEGPRNELEEFEEALTNFRLSSLEAHASTNPNEQQNVKNSSKIVDLIKRKL